MQLRIPTAPAWLDAALGDVGALLVDHAACERKASATGLSFVVRYPDRPVIHDPLIAFAREELEHFHRVYKVIAARGLELAPDRPDPYVVALGTFVRTGRDERLLDRLLLAGVVEARGCERMGLLATALPDADLKELYADLARAEARHAGLFPRLARACFGEAAVSAGIERWLDREAEIVGRLELRPALH